MAFHNEIGSWGEDLAVEYLASEGYAIAGRNIRVGRTEIDIIAMKGDGIMFVEVKTRTTHFKDPLDAVSRDKMRRLCRAADSYLRSNMIPHRPQFDITAIIGSKTSYELIHYPDAFFPPLTEQ